LPVVVRGGRRKSYGASRYLFGVSAVTSQTLQPTGTD